MKILPFIKINSIVGFDGVNFKDFDYKSYLNIEFNTRASLKRHSKEIVDKIARM